MPASPCLPELRRYGDAWGGRAAGNVAAGVAPAAHHPAVPTRPPPSQEPATSHAPWSPWGPGTGGTGGVTVQPSVGCSWRSPGDLPRPGPAGAGARRGQAGAEKGRWRWPPVPGLCHTPGPGRAGLWPPSLEPGSPCLCLTGSSRWRGPSAPARVRPSPRPHVLRSRVARPHGARVALKDRPQWPQSLPAPDGAAPRPPVPRGWGCGGRVPGAQGLGVLSGRGRGVGARFRRGVILGPWKSPLRAQFGGRRCICGAPIAAAALPTHGAPGASPSRGAPCWSLAVGQGLPRWSLCLRLSDGPRRAGGPRCVSVPQRGPARRPVVQPP